MDVSILCLLSWIKGFAGWNRPSGTGQGSYKLLPTTYTSIPLYPYTFIPLYLYTPIPYSLSPFIFILSSLILLTLPPQS